MILWLFALGLSASVQHGSVRNPPLAAYWEFEDRTHLGRYMGALRFCEKGHWTDESSRLQFLSRVQTALGQYSDAEENFQKAMSYPERKQFGNEEMAAARTVELTDPAPIIYRAAQDHRLLFINEAHFVPWHRAFGSDLLKGLRKLGFQYLFLETREPGPLQKMASEGLDRYSSERFGYDPVRKRQLDEAMRLGYKLEALDSMADGPPRLEHMANVVSELLLKDPRAKVLVWAGYSHVCKTPQWDGHLDAAALVWKRTKIEPYSVWQCAWDGSEELMADSLLTRAGRKLTGPTAIVPTAGDPFAKEAAKLGVDLLIAYPKCEGDGEHRPPWVLEGRRSFDGRIANNRAALIQAVSSGAPLDAVPVDQVVPGSDGRYILALPRGRYVLRVLDDDDRVLSRRHITVR